MFACASLKGGSSGWCNVIRATAEAVLQAATFSVRAVCGRLSIATTAEGFSIAWFAFIGRFTYLRSQRWRRLRNDPGFFGSMRFLRSSGRRCRWWRFGRCGGCRNNWTTGEFRALRLCFAIFAASEQTAETQFFGAAFGLFALGRRHAIWTATEFGVLTSFWHCKI